jgi:FkbM family methyltransferase
MKVSETTVPDKLRQLLNELLEEDRQQTTRRVSEMYDRVAAPFQNRVVVFGAGQLGRFVLPALRQAGIEVPAYCDNNAGLWGTRIDGVGVTSPADAMERFGASACFLTAVYNPSAIRRQLRGLGCTRIVPYPVFFWKHWQYLPAEERLELPQRILEQAGEIPAAYELLADEASREEFRTQLRWRCLMDYDCLPKPDSPQDMYFAKGLFRLSSDEVMVDCGAFDGDSMQSFLEKVDGRFRHIYLFEPDPANLRSLAARIAVIPAELAARITTLPYGVGDHNGTVRFSADGDVGSKVVANGGTVEIECRTLDSVLSGRLCPTLIKMDIEGAETRAIPGGASVIARCRPILAVCAYHRCDHLWIIPKLLNAACPDSRIFLRRYAEECWETVYYAVPPERLLDTTAAILMR